MWLSAVLALVMLGDWSAQECLDLPSTNPRRLVTGLLGGLGVGAMLWSAARLVLLG